MNNNLCTYKIPYGKKLFSFLVYFSIFLSCKNQEQQGNIAKFATQKNFCKTCYTISDAYEAKDSVKSLYLTNISNVSIDSIVLINNLKFIKFYDCKNLDLNILFLKLSRLRNLKALYFENCNIKSIPSNIQYLTNLEELVVSTDTLNNISNNLYSIYTLKKLGYSAS
jgi:Leucine-rich repeat (LRR) protein